MLILGAPVISSNHSALTSLIYKRDIEHGYSYSIPVNKIGLELLNVVEKCKSYNLQESHPTQWNVHVRLPSSWKLQLLKDIN